MKIAIIGFGAASIGLIERLKNTTHELHIFEKSSDIYSSSISGIRADGKLFVSEDMGGDLKVPLDIQNDLIKYYISKTNDGQFEKGSCFSNKKYYNDFYNCGFQPIKSEFYHLGTDQLKDVLKNIYEEYCGISNIHFHFDSEVLNIEQIQSHSGKFVNLHFCHKIETYDYCVVGVGRSGHKLIKTISVAEPSALISNNFVDLGIRYEVPDHIVDDLNKEMYEFKVKYKSKTGYIVRTFCNNPSGYVVTEKYDDFTTVNGHSNQVKKSENTNFAILTTVQLTHPFNDPTGYGSYIAKLSNLLAGDNKVILQTYNNFKNSKRSKNLYRVKPTLAESQFILGDINLAFPRRIIESIVDFVDNLNNVIPGINNADNLVYAPEIKFYSNKMNNDKFENIKFIGDCSGWTRSIIYATAHGWMLGEKLI